MYDGIYVFTFSNNKPGVVDCICQHMLPSQAKASAIARASRTLLQAQVVAAPKSRPHTWWSHMRAANGLLANASLRICVSLRPSVRLSDLSAAVLTAGAVATSCV